MNRNPLRKPTRSAPASIANARLAREDGSNARQEISASCSLWHRSADPGRVDGWLGRCGNEECPRFPSCARAICGYILNRMVQYTNNRLDASFAALSDVTRRGVLEQLGRAEASITDLAAKFDMTLTGMKKHVGVLEQAGLVTTEKIGRVRTCKLGLRRLDEVAAWIEKYHQLWDARFEALDEVVEELKRKEKVDGRKKKE